jgi:peptide-methionine (S)-S-oxide reductase
MKVLISVVILLLVFLGAYLLYFQKKAPVIPAPDTAPTTVKPDSPAKSSTELATFGGGCFWCTEAVMQPLKGVEEVVSGYMGGKTVNPTYEEICTGRTGHAEVIQVTFDPAVISYAQLLQVFRQTHDPTTLNQQGADTGTQYRSVIFYHNEEQKAEAQKYKAKLDAAKIFDDPIVTEITAAEKFYPAEKYHQDFFRQNPGNGYCRAVIGPKLKKLKELFADKLK